jgi:hydroxymethylbilane synthase
VLRIGTRGSQLALWQARDVAARLETAHAVRCEIVVIRTTGDRLGEAPLAEAGGKRLFVREIEEALLDGRVDLAVHSAKDMPVAPVAGLTIGAVLPREEPWDAIVLPAGAGERKTPLRRFLTQIGMEHPAADDLTGARIGTSSVRRVSQLQRVLSGATFPPIRGNLDTRLRKLDEGQYDALVLAAAGLNRLGAGDRITARLPLEICVPAPGQGAIAVQIRGADESIRALVSAIDEEVTAMAVAAERAVVVALGGGCQTPIGAIALSSGDRRDRLDLAAIVISPDGQRALRASASGQRAEAEEIGRRAAADLLGQGAAALLAEIPPGG